jgi:imidazole glycerol-phosphate synthase subunit HisF
MLTRRIIPCLDLKDGQVVKGKRFTDLQWVGDPVAIAKLYEEQGADELILMDISASLENRETSLDVITQVAKQLSIPLTVGGGIRSLSEVRRLLNAGVDKVALNTAALENPQLIREVAEAFGSQCIVLAVDVKEIGSTWKVFSHRGTRFTGLDVLFWALSGQQLGAGELLITSIDREGTKEGYDLELIQMLSTHLSIPIIASGGAGTPEDVKDVLTKGNADAALASSLFHFNSCSIAQLKKLVSEEKILMRV